MFYLVRMAMMCCFFIGVSSIPVSSRAQAGDCAFTDDFQRADGPASGWTVFSGAWNTSGGRLVTGPTGAEHWAWAGAPASQTPANATITFDMDFLARGTNGSVGRHGGAMFCSTVPTQRYDGAASGYEMDWIDRQSDHGLRLVRVDNGLHTLIATGAANLPDPPRQWRIVIGPETIEIWGDGALLIDVQDNLHRGGHFGFWTWAGGQEVAYDNLEICPPGADALVACFSDDAAPPILAGTDIIFDAGCSVGDITGYSWDFGDGNRATGAIVEHTYDFADTYAVTLTVEGPGGEDVNERAYTVIVPEDCECDGNRGQDDFEDGALDGWTVSGGTWNVLNGAAEAGPAASGGGGAEQQLYLGNPVASNLPTDDLTIRFSWEYLSAGNHAGVGKHAGAYFYWDGAGNRWAGNTLGYQLWWIDRAGDHGLNLASWEPGLRVLQAGTGNLFAEPPAEICIKVSGDNIRVYGDGILAIDVTDSTHRGGQFALWTWEQGQHVRFDDICISGPAVPEVCDNDLDDDGDGAVDCDDDDCSQGAACNIVFLRGDTNNDGEVNISDPTFALSNLFLGGPDPDCADSADGNDDGQLDITDAIYVLNYLFTGGDAPPAPSPGCGVDSTPDALGCDSPPAACE